MSAPINILGLSANSPPGVFVQINFAQGVSAQANAPYEAVIIGNMDESVGTAGTDGYLYNSTSLVSLNSVQDANTLFGSGSPLARMWKAFVQVNPTTPVSVCPVKHATGVGSSLTITFSGTATQSGTMRLNVCADQPVDVSFLTGDTASVFAANAKLAVNAQTDLACTADHTSGALTLTAKVPGLRSNWLRASARLLNGSGLVSDTLRPTFFSGGTGSDSYTNVLNFLASTGKRYYYYVCEAGCDSVDATQFEAVKTQMDTLSQPMNGLTQRAFSGSSDTEAHTITTTTALNDVRTETVWLQNSDVVPSELAAKSAAAYSLFEIPNPLLNAGGVNWDGFGKDGQSQPFWTIPAPLDGSASSQTAIQSAILSGISPIKVEAGGRTSLVKRVTSRFLNGSVLDLRITDAGKVTICDQFADSIYSLLTNRFARKLIADDPLKGQSPLGSAVVSPSLVKMAVKEVIDSYDAAGLINGTLTLAGLVVQREPNSPSRISIQIPLYTADCLHQFGVEIDQVG